MNYLIDGYNLLFFLHPKGSLLDQRRTIIQLIQEVFIKKNLKGTIVFDGAHKREEESGIFYAPPIDIVFTPKSQSADEWIIEKISSAKNKKEFLVITDDTGIKRHVHSLGSQTETREKFLTFLFKAKQQNNQSVKKEVKESPGQLKRLLKIFTEKYEQEKQD